jgi:uncharacterized protein
MRMKFLLLVVAVVALLWLLRGSRRGVNPPPVAKPAPPPDELQAMVSCAHCGIHLPQNEALPGRGGVFCGEPHRAAFEKVHPQQ